METFVGNATMLPCGNSLCPLAKCGKPLLSTHNVVRFGCGHTYHLECVEDVLRDKDGPYCDMCDYLQQDVDPKASQRRWRRAAQSAEQQQRETHKIVQLRSLREAQQRGAKTIDDLKRLGLTYQHLSDAHAWPLLELYSMSRLDPVTMHMKLEMPLSFVAGLRPSASQLKRMGYTTDNMLRMGLNAQIARQFAFTPLDWTAHLGAMPQTLRRLGIRDNYQVAHVNLLPASMVLQQQPYMR